MNSGTKRNKVAGSKGPQETSGIAGTDHVLLERIREVREKCGGGVKMLPVVRYGR